jgi:hypothetical protein
MGVSRPVFELALVSGLMLIIMSPIARLRWINLRKIILLFFFIPLGLPVLAGAFQDIDGARGEMGTTFYTNIYSRANFNLLPPDGAGNGVGNDIGELVSFSSNPQFSGTHAVDVAAAYFFAKRSDVFNPADPLPVAFRQRYFSSPVGKFEDMTTDERWAQITTSTDGITRTIYGAVLIMFAFLEAMINLGFTLTLGLLLIAFMISLLFAYFSMFESMSVSILKKIADLFLSSWTISAIQALVLAATVSVARTGSSIGTLGVGLLALGIEFLFLFVSWQAMVSALTGFGIGSGMSVNQGMGIMMGPAAAAAGAAANVAAGATRLGLKAGGKALGMGLDAGSAFLARRKESAISRNRATSSASSADGGSYRLGAASSSASGASSASTSAAASAGGAPSWSTSNAAASPEPPGLPGNDQGATNGPQPRAAQRLQKSLDRHPISADRAAALMLDMRRSGQFSEHRRAGLIATLRDDHKLNNAQAQRYALLLQSRMHHLAPAPTNPPMAASHGMLGQP